MLRPQRNPNRGHHLVRLRLKKVFLLCVEFANGPFNTLSQSNRARHGQKHIVTDERQLLDRLLYRLLSQESKRSCSIRSYDNSVTTLNPTISVIRMNLDGLALKDAILLEAGILLVNSTDELLES